ncbi:fasciclin domain-containing protein [Nocardioides dongkuii]|uniref:fasciclin domain-containing protein n=1 Tax=Nocardioides dongkuii TaxID=2760089 RepID=UPI001877A42F|nr:fasciclin domain-containing protein [Nocardioides dongkuii]
MKLHHNLRRTGALTAAALTMTLGLAACSDDDGGESASDTSSSSSSAEETPMETPMESPSEDMPSGDAMDASAETYGAGCEQVPADGAGSFNGMATEPVASAASANPLLSTLVTAVGEAGLVDALNSAEELTVFAPANPAFEAIPKKDLKAVLADKKMLTQILTHHVVPQRISPDELSGEFETLNGDMVTIQGEGQEAMIGDEGAAVLCGGIQTANATVYVIDTVMMP